MLRRCQSHMKMANSMSSSSLSNWCFEPFLSSFSLGCY